MTILQIPLSEKMKIALKNKTELIGVSKSTYVKMLIAQDIGLLNFQKNENKGNLFNADRDNNGKGIPITDMKKLLHI